MLDITRRAARKAFGHEIVAVLQLTHSGRYSKPKGFPQPLIAHHSAVLDPRHQLPADYPLVTDDYLDRLQDVYLSAAKLAAQAGFEGGVDVKACHRYLVSELLASHTREGKYGGTLENRSRLLRETIGKIRHELPGIFATTRINVFDAIPYPYGFGVARGELLPDLSEPLEVIRSLRALGMAMVNVTVGNPYYNPHFGRPYDRPIVGVSTPDEHPLVGVARIVDLTRQVQQAFADFPVVATGYSWLRHLMPYLAAGVLDAGWATLFGQGRSAFAYPDAPRDILTKGYMEADKTCIACSGCSQIMCDGTMTGCVVRDSKIYGEQYKLGRRRSRVPPKKKE